MYKLKIIDNRGEYLMKKLILTLLLSMFILSAKANAETFNLKVADDAKYVYQTTSIVNSPDLLSSIYANTAPTSTLLKFKISDDENLYMDLQSSKIVSVKLHIFRFHTENQPISEIFYLENDDWQEGNWLTSHVAEYPEIKKDNKVGTLPTVAANEDQQDWVSAELDINKFLEDTNGIYTLSLINTNYSQRPLGLNSIDQFIQKEIYSGVLTPYLEIETAPVPEPSSMILGLMGLGSLLGLKRKKISL